MFKKHRTFNPRAAPKCRRLCETALDHRGRGTAKERTLCISSAFDRSCTEFAAVQRQDAKAWPVEFCHRSVREYFVAPPGVEKALREGTGRAYDLISRVDFNHEILRFVAELMSKTGFDYNPVLRNLALMSRYEGELKACSPQERQKLARLGRTSATLLYRWSGGLPGKDWSCLTLDGAQLPQADLTGKDFHGTSLRSANLSNSVFVDADFSAADLSGVRLEETGEVRSLSVTRQSRWFLCRLCRWVDPSLVLRHFFTSGITHRL